MSTTVKELTCYRPLADIFELVRTRENVIFLDSSLHSETGRFSIVGLEPYLVLEQRNDICYENGIAVTTTFLDTLRTHLKAEEEPNETPLPLISGALGYLSYDFGRCFEGIASKHESTLDMPDALMVFYDVLIIEDHLTHALYAAVQGKLRPAAETIVEIEQLLEQAS
ncbi:MAG: aminodeoxychorismate/anthranilate synthase component I, partial [Actinobacteria bacterium]|nr:aminodeoxychorismate/anthranilate synthase component I [Actinomycetota bacterium]